MMKIEQQVCSLELAKELKELGVKQESLWYWAYVYDEMGIYTEGEVTGCYGEEWFTPDEKSISAFTVAELGGLLPTSSTSWLTKKGATCTSTYSRGRVKAPFRADTEANARAKALIWLIENGHVKV